MVERRSEEGGGREEMWLCYGEADEGLGDREAYLDAKRAARRTVSLT